MFKQKKITLITKSPYLNELRKYVLQEEGNLKERSILRCWNPNQKKYCLKKINMNKFKQALYKMIMNV